MSAAATGAASGSDDPSLVKLYLMQISKHALLSAAEEIEISKQMDSLRKELRELQAEEPNLSLSSVVKVRYRNKEKALLALKNRMIEANLRLVVSIVRNFRSRGLSFLDLVSEGNLGLIAAVDRFDYRKGCRFSSYGTFWIRQTVLKALADKGAMIRRPIHVQAAVSKLYLATQHLTQNLCHDATPEELGDYLNWSRPRVLEVLQIGQDIGSLDRCSDGGSRSPFSDTIGDEKGVAPGSTLLESWMHSNLEKVLLNLPVRENRILRLRFGIGETKCHTLQEIGQILGITRERVRQLQNLSFAKLRDNAMVKELIESS